MGVTGKDGAISGDSVDLKVTGKDRVISGDSVDVKLVVEISFSVAFIVAPSLDHNCGALDCFEILSFTFSKTSTYLFVVQSCCFLGMN